MSNRPVADALDDEKTPEQNSKQWGRIREIERWLLNQIVAGALDDEDTHVRKLLQGVHQKLVVSGHFEPKLTVAYCGPSALATTISAATQDLGGYVEFSSDNQ